jgi:hypothetical protein
VKIIIITTQRNVLPLLPSPAHTSFFFYSKRKSRNKTTGYHCITADFAEGAYNSQEAVGHIAAAVEVVPAVPMEEEEGNLPGLERG